MKKYQNPHNHHCEESLRTVSRRDLAHDLGECIGLWGSNPEIGNDLAISEAIDALDKLLSPLSTDFVRAINGRKRKRGDPGLSAVNGNQTAEIRLVCRKPTVVATSELVGDWPSQPKTYPNEDTQEEAEERAQRAAQVAVDFELIRKQSTIPYPSFRAVVNSKYKLEQVSAPKTIAVVEHPKPKQSPVHLSNTPGQPKIRDTKMKKALIVSARSDHILPSPRSESRLHTFYHSGETIGGKSAGYAWGYRGSFPRPAGITGYLRDGM
ncbi:unnamed protein product [Rhizoctonia solani]|uniref:Uncharacterized protein n=1 Tax=Rhizoctonia solani TaxID=456999 RepID=A0A8H2ZYC9_9AGAM|nr:unnamed protein product [Rhizoctonia solani]CAE6500427.1 unnamed protein product [Rhizoctonia solani]